MKERRPAVHALDAVERLGRINVVCPSFQKAVLLNYGEKGEGMRCDRGRDKGKDTGLDLRVN